MKSNNITFDQMQSEIIKLNAKIEALEKDTEIIKLKTKVEILEKDNAIIKLKAKIEALEKDNEIIKLKAKIEILKNEKRVAKDNESKTDTINFDKMEFKRNEAPYVILPSDLKERREYIINCVLERFPDLSYKEASGGNEKFNYTTDCPVCNERHARCLIYGAWRYTDHNEETYYLDCSQSFGNSKEEISILRTSDRNSK